MACIKNIVVYGAPGAGKYFISHCNIYMLYHKEKHHFIGVHWSTCKNTWRDTPAQDIFPTNKQ